MTPTTSGTTLAGAAGTDAQHWAAAFVCYAWEQRDFVKSWTVQLQRLGIRARGDWEFVDGQDFRLQAERLILECEFFLFVISSASLASDECQRELKRALALGKRVLPVSRQDCTDSEYEQLPQAVRLIDFCHVRTVDEEQSGTLNLVEALRTNLDFALVHRRLSVRTDDWLAGLGPLAAGTELKTFEGFEEQAARNPDMLPRPAPSQLTFIAASRQLRRSRRRTITATSILVGMLTVGIAVGGTRMWLRNREGSIVQEVNAARGYIQKTEAGTLRVYFDAGGNPERALKLVPQLDEVGEVDLGATAVADEHLEPLRGVRGVSRLMLYKTTITDAALQHVATLGSLKYLDLEETAITDAGADWVLQLEGLEELNVAGTRMTWTGLRRLGSLPRLRILRAEGTSIEAELGPVEGYPTLRYLSLSRTKLGDDGLRRLAHLPALEELILEETSITGTGFSEFQRDSALKEIWAKGSAFNNDGMRSLSGLRNLVRLSVPDTRLDEEGLQYVANLSLAELYIGGNNISEHGLYYLTNAISIRKLWMLGNSVGDFGVEHLSKMTYLEELRLGARITDERLLVLKARLPGAYVER